MTNQARQTKQNRREDQGAATSAGDVMTSATPRITGPTIKILEALLSPGVQAELCGAEISGVTKLASGTLYPALFRLERAGWLKSRWETEDPRALGRPRRRFYQLTGLGERNAMAWRLAQ